MGRWHSSLNIRSSQNHHRTWPAAGPIQTQGPLGLGPFSSSSGKCTPGPRVEADERPRHFLATQLWESHFLHLSRSFLPCKGLGPLTSKVLGGSRATDKATLSLLPGPLGSELQKAAGEPLSRNALLIMLGFMGALNSGSGYFQGVEGRLGRT